MGAAIVNCPVDPAAQEGVVVDPAGRTSGVGAAIVAVPVTATPQPSVILTVYAPWLSPVNILLLVFAILLPCGGRMAAPGLISSKLNGPSALAPGVTVNVPAAGVVQLAVTVEVNVGAVAAATATVVIADVPHTSFNRTVYVPGGRFANRLSFCGGLVMGDGAINSNV